MTVRNVMLMMAAATFPVAGLFGAAVADEAGEDTETGSSFVTTAAVQVTANPDPARAHAIPVIAANPVNNELVIVETAYRRSKACSVHLSVNDGRTWNEAGSPLVEPYTDCGSDPTWTQNLWATFDSQGTLYVAFTAHDPQFNDRPRNSRPRHVFLARSPDGGRSFDTQMVHEAPAETDTAVPADVGDGVVGTHTNRLPRIAVDPSDPSRVYVSWQQGGWHDDTNRALIAASDDGGETFQDPQSISHVAADGGPARHPRIAVDGSGVVHTVIPIFASDEPQAVLYRHSRDNGQSWSDPETLQDANPGLDRKWELEADPNSSALYLIWQGGLESGATLEDTDRDLFIRVSRDGGDNWGDPTVVNDDDDGVQQHDPGIAIAPNGRLDVAWFDFRNSPYPEEGFSGGANDVYYAGAQEQGSVVEDNVRITDRIIDREIGVWSNNSHIHGHVGVASTNEAVYFAWQDTRNGDPELQSEDVYFASLKREGLVSASERGAVLQADTGVSLWLLLVAVLIAGMGLSMLISGLWVRRVLRRG